MQASECGELLFLSLEELLEVREAYPVVYEELLKYALKRSHRITVERGERIEKQRHALEGSF